MSTMDVVREAGRGVARRRVKFAASIENLEGRVAFVGLSPSRSHAAAADTIRTIQRRSHQATQHPLPSAAQAHVPCAVRSAWPGRTSDG